MSFLSVIKSIENVFNKVTSVVTPIEPVIATIPVYGVAFDTIFNTIVAVEGLFTGLVPQTSVQVKTGSTKKAVVTTIVNSTVPTPIPEATLSTTIDQIVAALNQLQAAQASIGNIKA